MALGADRRTRDAGLPLAEAVSLHLASRPARAGDQRAPPRLAGRTYDGLAHLPARVAARRSALAGRWLDRARNRSAAARPAWLRRLDRQSLRAGHAPGEYLVRSEERRVGEEGR